MSVHPCAFPDVCNCSVVQYFLLQTSGMLQLWWCVNQTQQHHACDHLQELAHEEVVRSVKLEQAKEVTKLRQEVELGAKELASKYERKMKVCLSLHFPFLVPFRVPSNSLQAPFRLPLGPLEALPADICCWPLLAAC